MASCLCGPGLVWRGLAPSKLVQAWVQKIVITLAKGVDRDTQGSYKHRRSGCKQGVLIIAHSSASQKHRLVTGPGGLFATRLATESGCLATNSPCDKPIGDYSTLHRGPRQRFETEGPPRGDHDKTYVETLPDG